MPYSQFLVTCTNPFKLAQLQCLIFREMLFPLTYVLYCFWFLSHQYMQQLLTINDAKDVRCITMMSIIQSPIDLLMTWGKTGEWPGEMPALKWQHGPLCPNFHTSQLPMECRTNLTPGIWVHCKCSLWASAASRPS